MRTLSLVLPTIALSSAVLAQEAPPVIPKAPAQILLLGTFHFDDAGLDAYKPRHRLDVLSPARQREIEEVVRCLSMFRPTKVAIEAPQTSAEQLDRRFKSFLDGEAVLSANEVEQLGFRTARAMGHSRVYPVDAPARWYQPEVDLEEYAEETGQAHQLRASETPWENYFTGLYRYLDSRKTRLTIRQSLSEINREESVLRSHGAYLVRSFKVGVGKEFPGVDVATAWYNRNLRIFRNLQRITSGSHERLLLVIGSGHLPILWHAAEASPEYVRVDVDEVLGPACDAERD